MYSILELGFSGFLLSIYYGWAIYFIRQLVYLRRKRINLKYKENEENFNLRYHYKTEYYKFALMLSITLIEAFIVGVTVLFWEIDQKIMQNNSSINETLSPSLIKSTVYITINSLTVVGGLATVSLLNILTVYMSYVCRSYTEFSPIKRKLRNLIILILMLILLTLLIVIGAVLTWLIGIIIGTYEYIQLIKNSKQLYNLLKKRYKQLLIDSQYQEYQKQKKIVNRYKWFTIFILVALAGFMISLWVNIPYTTITSILINSQHIEAIVRISNNEAYSAVYTTLKWTERTIVDISSGILSVNIIWMTLVAIFENKNCASLSRLFARKKKRAIMKPLLP